MYIKTTPFPAPHAPRAVAATPATPQAPDPGVAGSTAARDPLAQFGAMHGLHPGVQQFGYADKNGASGGATKKTQGTGTAHPTSTYKASTSDVFDVSRTDAATIAKLKASADPATRRLGRTIENAKVAYGDLLGQAKPPTITVKLSDGNGGQPVMVLTGPGFDPKGHVTVHTHYHGDNATVADPLGSKAGTNARIREVIAAHPQTVFVLPEADNTKEGTDSPLTDGKYDYSGVGWRSVVSQAATTEDALKSAGIAGPVDLRVVSLHSGAGKLIPRLLSVDASGAGLRADRLELHDSLYGKTDHDWKKGPDPFGWEQGVARWSRTANGKAAQQVVYYHGTNDGRRQQAIQTAFKDRFTVVEMSRQGPTAPVNPIYVDDNGKSFKRTVYWRDGAGVIHKRQVDVRQFHDDPHYRTTGQFLGADPPPMPRAAPGAGAAHAAPRVAPARPPRPE